MGVSRERALGGRRVLELADEKGVYCGKLLADMGADVVKIERPGGDATRAIPPFWGDVPDRDRSLFFLYTNTSKRGVTLDLERPDGRDLFRRLAATADLVVETCPPGHLDDRGIGWAALGAANPRLVLTSITPFGQTGPHRRFRSSDLVASALGGALHVTGEETDPPVTLAGGQAHMAASLFAAVASMIALHHATATGMGQHVDISVEEAVASVAHISGVGKWLDDGIVPKRWGTSLFASVPSGTYPCTDGLVYLMVNRSLHWKALAEWIHEVTGNRDVLDPRWEGPSSNRYADRDLLDVHICELTTRFTVDEMYREGQRRHIAFAPVGTARAVVRDPHLAARGFFVDVPDDGAGGLRCPGAPYRLGETPWAITRRAPRVGEHNDEVYGGERGIPARSVASSRQAASSAPGRPQALAGVRVVEFTSAMAGPWVGRLMAWCGAEVIRVESKGHPDVVRLYVPPWAPELGTQPECSPWFTDWNAGKRFVALDLGRPDAGALAKRLVGIADVVVENQTTGVMDRLGLSWEVLREVKPDLVMLSTSGYGDSGPSRHHVAWGPNIEAHSGLASLSGFPERECTVTQYAYPDAVSALHGLFAVLCALDHRARTGQGQYVTLSQLETTVAVIGHVLMEYLANGREPARLGNRSLDAAPQGCYRCAGEDRWCAVTVSSDAEWARLCAAIGRPALTCDPRFATLAERLASAAELDAVIEEWTCTRDAYAVMAALQEAGVAAGVVQTAEDLLRHDRQLAARGFFEQVEHLRNGRVVATGIPLGLTGTPGRTGRAGAAVGEDNAYVFGQLLGMSSAEIDRFVAAGAIEMPEGHDATEAS